MLNFYNLFITLPDLKEQLSLVKKLQRAKVETWQGGHSAVLGGGTTLKKGAGGGQVLSFLFHGGAPQTPN